VQIYGFGAIMKWLDWSIVIAAVMTIIWVGRTTSRYMQGVSDFLAANRLAGRYMLTISAQVAGTGLVSVIGAFEVASEAGFTAAWWSLMSIPVFMVIALSGFFFYRYRETRSLTLAQFLEKRYGSNFRKFAGIVCFLTGLINFGVFPIVSARFYVHFLGLPATFALPGVPFEISTFAAVMALDLSIALMMVLMGGQISVMVTDCVQGIFSLIGFVLFAVVVLVLIGWADIQTALEAAPMDASMLHPMQSSGHRNFNMWFFMIGMIGGVFSMVAWQGSQGYNASARSPHEHKMGQIIGGWRWAVTQWMAMVLAVGAFTILSQPQYADLASTVQAQLDVIADQTTRRQMTVPLVLSEILPGGVKGLFFAVMIFLSITTHNTYLHSWGSIFIQDVFIPFRGRQYGAKEHIRLLRWSILGVAVYAFIFGMFYSPTVPIFMYWAITGTIWLPGAGAAVIGGIYWKRGTTSAAYVAIACGMAIGIFGLIVPPLYERHTGDLFPLTNQILFFIALVISSVSYVAVSLLTSRGKVFNLTRLLHRGEWAIEGDHTFYEQLKINFWQRLVGINKEFSPVDRFLAVALVVWNLGWVGLFLVVTVLNVISPFSVAWWAGFWRGYVWFYLVFNIVLAIWFTTGGIMDIRYLLRKLATVSRDATDDGRVEEQVEELKVEEKEAEPLPKATEADKEHRE